MQLSFVSQIGVTLFGDKWSKGLSKAIGMSEVKFLCAIVNEGAFSNEQIGKMRALVKIRHDDLGSLLAQLPEVPAESAPAEVATPAEEEKADDETKADEPAAESDEPVSLQEHKRRR